MPVSFVAVVMKGDNLTIDPYRKCGLGLSIPRPSSGEVHFNRVNQNSQSAPCTLISSLSSPLIVMGANYKALGQSGARMPAKLVSARNRKHRFEEGNK